MSTNKTKTKKPVKKVAGPGAKQAPKRVALVTWVSPAKKRKIAAKAQKAEFRSVGAFVRAAIDEALS